MTARWEEGLPERECLTGMEDDPDDPRRQSVLLEQSAAANPAPQLIAEFTATTGSVGR